jgi:hypothetical protein
MIDKCLLRIDQNFTNLKIDLNNYHGDVSSWGIRLIRKKIEFPSDKPSNLSKTAFAAFSFFQKTNFDMNRLDNRDLLATMNRLYRESDEMVAKSSLLTQFFVWIRDNFSFETNYKLYFLQLQQQNQTMISSASGSLDSKHKDFNNILNILEKDIINDQDAFERLLDLYSKAGFQVDDRYTYQNELMELKTKKDLFLNWMKKNGDYLEKNDNAPLEGAAEEQKVMLRESISKKYSAITNLDILQKNSNFLVEQIGNKISKKIKNISDQQSNKYINLFSEINPLLVVLKDLSDLNQLGLSCLKISQQLREKNENDTIKIAEIDWQLRKVLEENTKEKKNTINRQFNKKMDDLLRKFVHIN